MKPGLSGLWRGSLRRQLILAVAGVHALLMSLFIWDVTGRQQKQLLQVQAEQAQAMAHAMATSSAGWLASRDVAGLQEIVEAQRRYPELIFAMLLDRQGLVLAHTDRTRVGQYVQDLPADGTRPTLTHTPQLVDVVAPVGLTGRQIGWVRVGIGQRAAGAQLAHNTRDGIIYALAAIGIGSLIAGVVGTRLTAKLYAIRRVSAAVRAGRRDARVPELGPDETGRLGSDFNEMLLALETRETALRESEQRFRQVTENIDEVFWLTDTAKERMIYISPAYQRVWGRTCESLYAGPGTWLEAVHPEDRERVRSAMLTQQVSGTYDLEYRILRPDGELRWIRDRAFPIKYAGGAITRIAGVAEDITERKQLERQFLHAQRMEAIGTLAGGVAHDLNNILSPVLMATELLKGKLAEPHDREILAMVERGARRGAGIIRQLLTFSHGIEGTRGSVQPRHLLKEMAQTMHETFPRNINIVEKVPADLWNVEADATQLHQVLMNLGVNARDAMPEGGTLTMACSNVELHETDVRSHPPAKPGPYVVITVSDTGHGIPPAIIERIFDPFFTTKGVGKGTGLGLSTVLGIVKSHGGFVTVYSEVHQGSVFKVYLPAISDAKGDESATADAPSTRGHGETILVVDDEPPVRQAIGLVLEKNGYQTLQAANGEEAIRLCHEHRGVIKLVLTDMMMPVMGGLELARTLHALDPGLRIIASSGIDRKEQSGELAQAGVTEILGKPFPAAVLLRAVNRALTDTPAASGRAKQDQAR